MLSVASSLNLLGTFVLLAWPTRRCPDLICPEHVVTERVPESIANSLERAQQSASDCYRDCLSPTSSSFSISGFWLGFCCGFLAALVVAGLAFLFLSVCCGTPSSRARSVTSGNMIQARTLAPISFLPAISSSSASSSGQPSAQPATPSQLRAAGLLD
jgi:hypothetical protein